jgi:D-arabinitol dehydrogenase (NADP+)
MSGESEALTISPFEIFRRQIAIKGAFAHTYGFARAIGLIRAGKVNPDGIVTHRFALDDYSAALAALSDPECLKAVVQPS